MHTHQLRHGPGAILGHRRDGRPIYIIAGGSTPAEPAAPPADPPAGDPAPTPQPPAAPPAPAPAGDGDTDWKAMARQWEKRAKENGKAADELEKLRKASMTEQEKAVAEAEAKGRTAAAADYGRKLAAAEMRAAAAAAGVDLSEIADLIDVSRFVGDDGEVDAKAIKAAVAKFSKLSPAKGPGRSGGDHTGGSGDGPASLDKQIADAEARRAWPEVIRLKRQRAAQTT
jgi:hypothetical protein